MDEQQDKQLGNTEEIISHLASFEDAVRKNERKRTPVFVQGPRYRVALVGFILLWLGLGFALLRSDYTSCQARSKTNAGVVHLVERLTENSRRANVALIESKNASAEQKKAAKLNLEGINTYRQITKEELGSSRCSYIPFRSGP